MDSLVVQINRAMFVTFTNYINFLCNQVYLIHAQIHTFRSTNAGIGVKCNDGEVSFVSTFKETLAKCLHILLFNSTRICVLYLHLHKIILQDCQFRLTSG